MTGTVQGVGFRPFVYRLAREAGVSGRVRNDAAGVTIEAFAPRPALEAFTARLRTDRPPAAVIETLEASPIPAEAAAAFEIVESGGATERRVAIPPDLGTCEACRREILDPTDRRHGYPFTNCTDCGPRFTIALGVPYDRPATTMAGFTMCPACAREYGDPGDRRFHAQPNACPVCGPKVSVRPPAPGDPIAHVARALAAGQIAAVKGIGGYHLACDATSEAAVALLRQRKHREEKPLAIMVRDLAEARAVAALTPAEEALLASVERPIVLVRRRAVPLEGGAKLAAGLAPGSPLVGVMLPYAPLHHLLLAAAGRPLVMTSGNLSDEPIAFEDEDALRRLSGIADLFLVHDRPIASRADDSVTRVVAGRPLVMRRSRGWAPRPVVLSRKVRRPVLAVGAQLKNTFCLARGDEATLGPHVGDLDDLETYASFEAAVARLEAFLEVRPEAVACDLHPLYLSTRYARERAAALGVPLVEVQHHHAHAAAAMAEHGLEGPVLALAWDGTGLGTDGAVWGGEVLRVEGARFERVAHLRTFRLPGGDQASRDGRRSALGLLHAIDPELASRWARAHFAPEAARGLVQLLDTRIAAPITSSMGRLFDGLAVLLGLGTHSSYEGELARALEVAATDADVGELPAFPLSNGVLDFEPLVRAALSARDVARTAAAIHAACVDAIVCLAETAGIERVVLSGGCFQNTLLLAGARARLEARGFSLFTPELVPINDGGISVGQAFVACVSESRAGS